MKKYFTFLQNYVFLWMKSVSIACTLWLICVPAYADLYQNTQLLLNITEDFALVAGVGLILGAFFKFKKQGEQRGMGSSHSIADPLLMMLCGALLLSFPWTLATILNAFWGQTHDIPSSDISGTINLSGIIELLRVFGVISFFRGILQFARAGKENSQPGQVGKGFMFIIAGLLLVHINQTVQFLLSFMTFLPSASG